MSRKKQEILGIIFGRLKVISQAPSRNKRTRWNCECSCTEPPTLCVAEAHALKSGRKKSCGCLRKEAAQRRVKILGIWNTLPDGEASLNLLYATYRNQAGKRGLEFSLTREDFQRLTSGNCFYCGIEPKQVYKASSCKTPCIYNGVDRQDNKKGYILSNCVSCCGICNDMKRTRTVDQFLAACLAVTKFQNLLDNPQGVTV